MKIHSGLKYVLCVFLILSSLISATSQDTIPTEFEGKITGKITITSSGISGWDRVKGNSTIILTTEMEFNSCPDCILRLRKPEQRANIIKQGLQYPVFWGKTARDESGEPVKMKYTTQGTEYSTEFSTKDVMQLVHEYKSGFTTDCYDWSVAIDVANRSKGSIPYLTTQYWIKSELTGNIRMYTGNGKYTNKGNKSGKQRVDEDKMESYSEAITNSDGIFAGVIKGCEPENEANTNDNICEVLFVENPHILEEYLLNPQGNHTLNFRGRRYSKDNENTYEEIYEIAITFWPKGARDTISIEGCDILAVGESVLFPVTCKPPGGQVTYWAEGEGITVTDGGNGALVNAVTTGSSGTVCIKYVTKEGKVATRFKPVSVVQVNSINGNKPLKVGLYDAEGKLVNPPKQVTFSAEPPGGSTQLIFRPEDETMLSIARTGHEQLTIQGLQCGETSIQALTDCETKTGPPLTIVVVNCDDDVIKELRKEAKILKDNLERNIKRQIELLTSEEFVEADKNGKNTIESVAKGLTDLAITAYSPKSAGGNAVKKTYSLVNNIVSIISNIAREEWGPAIWEAANLAGAGTKAGDVSGVAKTLYDLMSNVEKMSGYLGTVAGVSDRLSELMEEYDKTQKEYFKVLEILHRTCREKEDKPSDNGNQDGDGTNPGDDPKDPQNDKPGNEPDENFQDIPVNKPGDPSTENHGHNNNDPYTPSTPKPEPTGGTPGGAGIPLDEKQGCSVVDIPEASKTSHTDISTQLIELKNSSDQIKDIYSGFSAMILDPLKTEIMAMEAFLIKVNEGPVNKNDTAYFNDLTELFIKIEGNDKANNLLSEIVEFNKEAGRCPEKLIENSSILLKPIK